MDLDLNEERGQLWNGELRTYLPGIDATVRLRAAQIRQQSNDRFHARDAWITTSEMGDPGYRIQASDIFLERRPFGGRPGAAPEDLVPFEKYAAAAEGLSRPSSAARALAAGAPNIERVDRLVQGIAAQRGLRNAAVDEIVALVDGWLSANRKAAA